MSKKLFYGLKSQKKMHEVYAELKVLQDTVLNILSTPWVDPEKYFSDKAIEQRKNLDESYLRTTLQLVPVDSGTLAIPNVDDSLCFALGMKRDGVMALIQEKTSLKPYPFWDNMDAPPDVSEEEWTRRETDWGCCKFPENRCGVQFLFSEISDFIVWRH
jgi:hypothetical protein